MPILKAARTFFLGLAAFIAFALIAKHMPILLVILFLIIVMGIPGTLRKRAAARNARPREK